MKRRSVTRTIFASPIFWLAVIAWTAGLIVGDAGSALQRWISIVACVIIAAATDAIERWYVQPRTAEAVFKRHFDKAMRESGARARFLDDDRPPCPEHGRSCSVICRYRPRGRHA